MISYRLVNKESIIYGRENFVETCHFLCENITTTHL